MKDFKAMPAVGEESLTDQFWVDANGAPQPIYSKRLAISAFPNNTTGTKAHGIGASLNLNAGLNVRKVTAVNAGVTIALDKTKISFTIDATNVNLTTTADYSGYAGEIVIEYCKS